MAIIRKSKVKKLEKLKEKSERKRKDNINKREKQKRSKVRQKKNQVKYQKKHNEKLRKQRAKIKKPADHIAPYRIIITRQKKTIGSVYVNVSKNKAISVYDKIVEANKNSVRFPVQYSSTDHVLIPSKFEILLMKTKEQYDGDYTLLRNEYGKIVPHYANSDKMVIFKKDPYLLEETFWVYGYHPREQRKTFTEIIDSIVLKNVNVKSSIIQKRILVYRNKLIIENEYGEIDIIMCKCKDDCERFYFELEKEMASQKIKSVFFGGRPVRSTKSSIIKRIQQLTGWNMTKIYRDSTRP